MNIWFFSFLLSLIATGFAISVEEIVVYLKKFAIPAIPVEALIIGCVLIKNILFIEKTLF